MLVSKTCDSVVIFETKGTPSLRPPYDIRDSDNTYSLIASRNASDVSMRNNLESSQRNSWLQQHSKLLLSLLTSLQYCSCVYPSSSPTPSHLLLSRSSFMAFFSSPKTIPPGSLPRNTLSNFCWAKSKATSLTVNWPMLWLLSLLFVVSLLWLPFAVVFVSVFVFEIVQEYLPTSPLRFNPSEIFRRVARSDFVTPTKRPRLGPTGRKLWGITCALIVGSCL
mmetsp:Transcript_10490/g.22366  ORF Transcript_10490/g.22366 Transcript_10490/m.22366 type:complete len:222 (-) Transcript_10490:726-1391(-)